MAQFDVTIPDEVADQVVPVLQQLLQQVGGTLEPDTDDTSAAAKGMRQTKRGARANRPANLKPPVPTAPPAPMPGAGPSATSMAYGG